MSEEMKERVARVLEPHIFEMLDRHQDDCQHCQSARAFVARRAEQAIAAVDCDSLTTQLSQALRERDAWIETAQQYSRDKAFYHGLVTAIGERFGDAAKTSDDGSLQQDVLALAVPDLVGQALRELGEARDMLKRAIDRENRLQSARDAALRSTAELTRERDEARFRLADDAYWKLRAESAESSNAELRGALEEEAVAAAMQDAWNEICSDTGCHPTDIEHQGKKLFFRPAHWARMTAQLLIARTAIASSSTKETPG